MIHCLALRNDLCYFSIKFLLTNDLGVICERIFFLNTSMLQIICKTSQNKAIENTLKVRVKYSY